MFVYSASIKTAELKQFVLCDRYEKHMFFFNNSAVDIFKLWSNYFVNYVHNE